MSNIMKYAILRYSPSLISGESINLGVLFSYENETWRRFDYISNFKRLSSFDDEIETDHVRMILQAIQLSVENNISNNQKPFNIEKYTKYYCNEFNFSKVVEVAYEDSQQKIEEIKKVYLRYDYPKTIRPAKSEEVDLISEIIQTKSKKVSKNAKFIGRFHENIAMDLNFDDYYIKIFHITKKNKSSLINFVKSLAYSYEKDAYFRDHVIVLYQCDDDVSSDVETPAILSILQSLSSAFYNIDSGIEKIMQLIQ